MTPHPSSKDEWTVAARDSGFSVAIDFKKYWDIVFWRETSIVFIPSSPGCTPFQSSSKVNRKWSPFLQETILEAQTVYFQKREERSTKRNLKFGDELRVMPQGFHQSTISSWWCQIALFPQDSVWKYKSFELPPPQLALIIFDSII